MIIPIRCFSCNGLIADKWVEYNNQINSLPKDQVVKIIGKEIPESYQNKILNDLGVERYCCRRMFLGNLDMTENLS